VYFKILEHFINVVSLMAASAEGSSFENYEEAGRLVKVAARDCTPLEIGSILDFQTRTGVEVGRSSHSLYCNVCQQIFSAMERKGKQCLLKTSMFHLEFRRLSVLNFGGFL